MKRKTVIYRFNLVEVALALVVLAIGLSSVMVLFPVGLKASRSSIADNNLADIAERVGAYFQSEYTSQYKWKRDGSFDADNINDNIFDPNPANGTVPTSALFSDASEARGMDGLLEKKDGTKTYYLYRQYSAAPGSGTDSDRAVDFEAMIRVGWDPNTLGQQYYLDLTDKTWKQLNTYSHPTHAEGSGLPNSPFAGQSAAEILNKCCRTLIIEISWPADVEWEKREKRIFRVEIFNENFVPYPQTASNP